jgi:hypothetical protein
MIHDVRKLLDDYTAWLRDKTTLRQVEQWVEITTPYLDRHNDFIQIYARQADGGWMLTDDGATIDDLELCGCVLQSPKRLALLQMTLNGFGVQRSGQALEVRATAENFAIRKHNLVQAILAVNDMFYLAEPVVANLFLEDVTAWLDLMNVRYTPQVKFSGKSGFDHMFDFVIPKSRVEPERIMRCMNRPSRDTAQALAFAWIDTRGVRPSDSRAFALLNDGEHAISGSVMDALKQYEVRPVLWSERDAVRAEWAN